MTITKKGHVAIAAVLLAFAIAPMCICATASAISDTCYDNEIYDAETDQYSYGPHELGEWATQKGDTCKEHNVKARTCKWCGEVIESEELSTFGDHCWYTERDANIFHAKLQKCDDCGITRTVGKKKSMSSTDKAVVKVMNSWFTAVKKCDQGKLLKLYQYPEPKSMASGLALSNAQKLNGKYVKYELVSLRYSDKKRQADVEVSITYPNFEKGYEKAAKAYAKWYKKKGTALKAKYVGAHRKLFKAKYNAVLKKNHKVTSAQYNRLWNESSAVYNKKLTTALGKQMDSYVKKNVNVKKPKLETVNTYMYLVKTSGGWKVNGDGNYYADKDKDIDYISCGYWSSLKNAMAYYGLSVWYDTPKGASV